MKTLKIALVALALSGCDAGTPLLIQPADREISSLEARFVPAGTGGGIVAFDSATLPVKLQDAKSLQLAFGPLSVPVTKSAKGHTAAIPANARLNLDVEGRLPLVFIVDQASSQVIDVKLTQVPSL